jgi:hypothetical protein
MSLNTVLPQDLIKKNISGQVLQDVQRKDTDVLGFKELLVDIEDVLPVDYDTLPFDEFFTPSDGFFAQRIEAAQSYMGKYSEQFIPDTERKPFPALSDCKGVIFTLAVGKVFFDSAQSIFHDDINWYSILVNALDESYEPIFLITSNDAIQVTSTEYKEMYTKLFE